MVLGDGKTAKALSDLAATNGTAKRFEWRLFCAPIKQFQKISFDESTSLFYAL